MKADDHPPLVPQPGPYPITAVKAAVTRKDTIAPNISVPFTSTLGTPQLLWASSTVLFSAPLAVGAETGDGVWTPAGVGGAT